MNDVTRTQAIKNFLNARTHADLAELYNHDMECQVNVMPGNGTNTQHEYRGKSYQAWTDGFETWKPFRIPYNAASEPEYTDRHMSYNLAKHVESIGMTGWDWVARKSRWVGFDFDAIIGHAENHSGKLTADELSRVEHNALELDYVMIRQSTSGTGLHLYVFLDEPVETRNHNEHAALGRAILMQMSYDIGFDFSGRVDIAGGNMWVWHRKMELCDNQGLRLIRPATGKIKIPENWRAHLDVIENRRSEIRISIPSEDEENTNLEGVEEAIEEMKKTQPAIQLDEDHKRIIAYLINMPEWDTVRDTYIKTHTIALKSAHTALGLKGLFETNSSGSSRINCWIEPLPKGGFAVYRYSKGVNEHPSWHRSHNGFTTCFYNTLPTLRSASYFFNGVENPKGGYEFSTAADVIESLRALGASYDEELPDLVKNRSARMSDLGNNRVLIEIDCKGIFEAVSMPQWGKKGNYWFRVFYKAPPTVNINQYDNEYDSVCRHLLTEDFVEYKWAYAPTSMSGEWALESKDTIRLGLTNRGCESKDINDILGYCVNNPWVIVNEPFREEYLGDRRWNYGAAKFTFPLRESNENLSFPTWMKILNHVGLGLDRAVKEHEWCRHNGITCGGDYLKAWCAYMFQKPKVRLPYLFFYSPQQKTGKTTFHESLHMLMKPGYMKADKAITTNFDGELRTAVLCPIEETDLSKDKEAYNSIKEYVTAEYVALNPKGKELVQVPNTTHWVQCANKLSYLPIEADDTRIVVCLVPPIPPEEMMSPYELRIKLRKEASDFLTELMYLELPEQPRDRMALPVLETEEKIRATRAKQTVVESFIGEYCFSIPGSTLRGVELYEEFSRQLDPQDRAQWPKRRFQNEIPQEIFPYGRRSKDGQWCYGNISLNPDTKPGKKLISVGGGDKARLIET